METTVSPVVVNPAFRSQIPPLRPEEYASLEASILAEGCRDALVVWADHGILLDGHNRFEICERHGIEYQVRTIDLPDREAAADWIDANQLGRRNLTQDQFTLLVGRRYERAKKAAGGRADRDFSGAQNDHPKTADRLAQEHGVGAATVRRAAKFAQQVAADPELQQAVAERRPVKQVIKQRRLEQRRAEVTAAAEAVQEQHPNVDSRFRLVLADIADAHEHVEAESVDWIITDPPYPQEYLPLYTHLSRFADYVLRPGGSLVCMVGKSYLPEILRALSNHLTYHWTLAYLTPGGQSAQLWERKVNTFWKPLLWFVKGTYAGDWIGDVCRSATNDNDKTHHHWGQSESGMADIVQRFTKPGQTVCDPFCGAGTTGVVAVASDRLFVGLDIDQEALATARVRIIGGLA